MLLQMERFHVFEKYIQVVFHGVTLYTMSLHPCYWVLVLQDPDSLGIPCPQSGDQRVYDCSDNTVYIYIL